MPEQKPRKSEPGPLDQRPLGQRMRDLADRLSGWVDSLFPESAPVLVPVPVRSRRRR